MEENGGSTFLLPFWCWCDEGPQEDARHRQHRHAIAVSPRYCFRKNVWKKVRVLNEPYRKIMQHNIGRINSPLNLIRVIDHLSNRKSGCRVSCVPKTYLEHFCINVTLPEHFKWILVSLWEGGLTRLIYEESERLGPDKLAPYETWIDGTWKFYLKNLPTVPKDLVFPVSKHFFPTTETTEYFLHLTDGRELYFEKKERVLDEMNWGRVQANSGNVFCKAFGNDLITPTSDERLYFKSVEPLMRRKAELEQEVERLKSEIFALKEEKRNKDNESTKSGSSEKVVE